MGEPTTNLPTSNIEEFRNQLLNPNVAFQKQQRNDILKIQKSLVIAYTSDSTGCGHIRNVFPMTYLNAIFGKSGRFNLLLAPTMPFMQPDLLARTRTIYFQRWMAPELIPIAKRYKEFQSKFKYKMIYDIDDFIWKGTELGECIPEYNFGNTGITDAVRAACNEIMSMMDIVCVSTEFLKTYIRDKIGIKNEIRVVPNAVARYFWGPEIRQPITKKIEKPRVLYSGSPTHYHNGIKLRGDWDNQWCDWIIKNVKDNKIEFICMGGLPFFFEELKDRTNFKVIDWVNSYLYHLPIKEAKPDFSIAPLVYNYFNMAKSSLKYTESCAMGAVFMGTVFTNNKPSPYDICPIKVPDTATVEHIDDIFWKLTEPEIYNSLIQQQYTYLNDSGLWLESPQFIKQLTDIF